MNKYKKSIILFAAAIFGCMQSFSQSADFASFAERQDSLMVSAYKAKNPNEYKKYLREFDARYDTLSKEDKRDFIGYRYNSYYNLCCTYSLLNQKDSAVRYFAMAVDAGMVDYSHVLEDSDLNNIRQEPEFKAKLQYVKSVGDYKFILQHAGAYNTAEKQTLPAFTYDSANDPNLVLLRKTLNLDSIAGQAGEVNRILNLMHWLHNLIPHDGEHGNPVVKNALSMINECKQTDRGLNCRGLATVLNECYLSMGFKSRFVTCLPKDSLHIDPDCHVIDMVWSNDLKKWLWIDPTFNAYVMDENGNLLSIEEVRERLVNNKPLILNPDANWNNRNTETHADYLDYYMSKNLYMLECAVNSTYNTETIEPNKTVEYVRLIPLDYFDKSLTKEEAQPASRAHGGVYHWDVYKTNNPDYFWQAPQ